MPSQIALREPLTDEMPGSHESDWRQSVIADMLTAGLTANEFEEELKKAGIEYDHIEAMMWVCHDRGGVTPEGAVTMSSWAGYELLGDEGRVDLEATMTPVL